MQEAAATKNIQRELKKLWTVHRVARHFEVTTMTVHNWRKRGMPTIIINGDSRATIRFVANDVKEWRRAIG
jgi:hypothetical protein